MTHNNSLIGCSITLCVGGIDLAQWKQGNTCFKSILKDLSKRDLFFCELLDTYIFNS